MVSLFELALANWAPICRFLGENVHEAFMVLVIFYRVFLGVAVVGVINAVFIQETFKVVNSDADRIIRNQRRAVEDSKKLMEELFCLADADGSGRISHDEFSRILKSPVVRTWLSTMEIDTDSPDVLFKLLAGDDHLISLPELIDGVGRLKGPARRMDYQQLLIKLEEFQTSCRV